MKEEEENEVRVLTMDDLKRKDEWVHKSEARRCLSCMRKFHCFRRKHHCRVCGEVVCSSCLMKKATASPGKRRKKVKVCLLCIIDLASGWTSQENESTTGNHPKLFSNKYSKAHDFMSAYELNLVLSWPLETQEEDERLAMLDSRNIFATPPEDVVINV